VNTYNCEAYYIFFNSLQVRRVNRRAISIRLFVDRSEKYPYASLSFALGVPPRAGNKYFAAPLKSRRTEKYIPRRAQSFMVAVQLDGNKCACISWTLPQGGGERRKWDSLYSCIATKLFHDDFMNILRSGFKPAPSGSRCITFFFSAVISVHRGPPCSIHFYQRVANN